MKSNFLLTFLLLFSITSYSQSTNMVSFLALGDSYTIGESVEAPMSWPQQLVDTLRVRNLKVQDPLIIAKTGWRTDDLKTAIKKQKPAKDFELVSLLIGVNNQYQGKSAESYVAEFKELLQIAIKHAGGNKDRVFVVSIPDYGYTPFGAENQITISKELDDYNAINKSITKEAGILYINITDISREKDEKLVAKDGLHPSAHQYSLWVERMANSVTQILGNKD